MNSTDHSVQDVPYTNGYYAALSPTMITTALEMKGLRAPDLSTPLNYCELGMGFGVSLLANAACFPNIRFFGNDFNARQAAHARESARDAGLDNVEVFDDSFEEMMERDLPQMDFIVLHGIYSWVSPALRQVIVEFIAKRLKLGGVVYVSHNALPGWSAAMPLRELFNLHARRMSPPNLSSEDRVQQALGFVKAFGDCQPKYFESSTSVPARLRMVEQSDPRYVAHEYFNPDWHPQYFHEVAKELSAARLSHAASAHLEDHVDAAWLSEDALGQLGTIADPVMRETLRDYHLNRGYRADLYVRGAFHLGAQEREARRLDRRWALVSPRSAIGVPMLRAGGTAVADAAQCACLLDALAEGAASVRDLLKHPAVAAMGSRQVIDALMLLCGTGHVQPALPEALRDAARVSVDRFNAASMARPAEDGSRVLVSSVTGQATAWTHKAALQIGLCKQGVTDAPRMAQAMWELLAAQGWRVKRPDGEHGSDEESITYLREGSRSFLSDQAPLLRRLGVM
jgi:SAM-dependent methyltransferase